MTIPQTIMEEARRLLREGNCVACIDDMHCSCIEPLCEALLAAEQRGAERERERAARIVDEMGGLMDRTPAEAAASIRNTKD